MVRWIQNESKKKKTRSQNLNSAIVRSARAHALRARCVRRTRATLRARTGAARAGRRCVRAQALRARTGAARARTGAARAHWRCARAQALRARTGAARAHWRCAPAQVLRTVRAAQMLRAVCVARAGRHCALRVRFVRRAQCARRMRTNAASTARGTRTGATRIAHAQHTCTGAVHAARTRAQILN